MNESTEDRRLLKRYLSQYYRAKEKQVALRSRLKELQGEMRIPAASRTDGDRAEGESTSLAVKIGDIEERIQRQAENEAQSVIEIMDILDFLPADSTEKEILEYRYIDCKPWRDIMSLVHLSRSPCFEYYNRGLDKLLTYRKVRKTLAAFEARMNRLQKDNY